MGSQGPIPRWKRKLQIAAAIEDCPSFDVSGSETHDLDEEIIRKSRRTCCSDCRRDRDA
ncbi:MAG: hypothetical protein V3T81_03145 [Thermoanaerobaculia bacterium]